MSRAALRQIALWWREVRREAKIGKLSALDRAAPSEVRRLVDLAADAFDAPIALFSLVKGASLQIQARRGVEMHDVRRCDSFCDHALDRPDELLEVTAPTDDARFRGLPVVTGEPRVRYYLGAPVRLADGTDVGAICILDTRERRPATPDERAYMRALARQAATAIEARAELLEAAA